MRLQQLSLDNLVSPPNVAAAGIGAVIAPWIDLLYGPDRQKFFWALVAVIILDWLTGIAASIKHGSYASQYGKAGVARTLIVLAFPVAANALDNAMGTPGALFYTITFGLLYHTWQSITANTYRAGFGKWIPKKLLQMVASEIKAKEERSMRQKEGKGN